MIEKKLKDLLDEVDEKRKALFYSLMLQKEDGRTNKVAKAEKELSRLLRLAQEWNKKLYNVDRFIKDNVAACLLSPDEDVRKRAQQIHQQSLKKKKRKKGKK